MGQKALVVVLSIVRVLDVQFDVHTLLLARHRSCINVELEFTCRASKELIVSFVKEVSLLDRESGVSLGTAVTLDLSSVSDKASKVLALLERASLSTLEVENGLWMVSTQTELSITEHTDGATDFTLAV